MREKSMRFIVTFRTTVGAMAMEKACKEENVPGRLIPVPRAISAGCGMCWMAPPEDKALVESELAEFKKVRESNDVEQIKSSMEAFTQKVYSVFGKIYQQQAQDPNAQTGGYQQAQDATNSDGASDADYDVH